MAKKTKSKTVLPRHFKDYTSLLRCVKTRIRQAQYEALRAVNRELIELYWVIGRMVVGRKKDQAWGKIRRSNTGDGFTNGISRCWRVFGGELVADEKFL